MPPCPQLACHDGLSLLHRAVESRCGATLRAVLGWGEDAGAPWRCDLAGPMAITPLHLAALLPDPAAARHAVLLLLSRCAPGARAWQCCCTVDGQTPADFYRAAGAARSSGGSSGAAEATATLEMEVAALLHLQQAKAQREHVPGVPLAAAAVPEPSPAPWLKVQAAVAEALSLAPAQQQAQPPAAAPGPASVRPAAAADPSGPEMQPSTPRKNPGCLCAPGCPCALLDR